MLCSAWTSTHSGARRCLDLTRKLEGKRERIEDIRHDHALDRRLLLHLAQARPEQIQQHDRLGAGIFELMLQLARGVGRVHIDNNRAQLHGAEERDHKVRRVRQHQRHAIALAHTELIEGSGKAVGQFVELAVGQLAAHREAPAGQVA